MPLLYQKKIVTVGVVHILEALEQIIFICFISDGGKNHPVNFEGGKNTQRDKNCLLLKQHESAH